MIHVILGTKAQLIKMAPLMALMQRENVPYNFIFTGQHQETINALRDNFALKNPDYVLHSGQDITSIAKMFFWFIKLLLKTVLCRKAMFKQDQSGIVLVHGDTFSTLAGALIGKLGRLKVAHIESGLRSFHLLHPFPEELTRLAVFNLSDYYFCPGELAQKNLVKYSGNKINTYHNTLLDALNHVLCIHQQQTPDIKIPAQKFCVISTHRFENWINKAAAERTLGLIEQIAKTMPCLFILHGITRKKLETFDMMSRLQNNPNIEIRNRYNYVDFIYLLSKCEFLVSDGGSNQEECFFMGKPCLLLRKASERCDGIGLNTVLSEYKPEKVAAFICSYKQLVTPPIVPEQSPSQLILDTLKPFI